MYVRTKDGRIIKVETLGNKEHILIRTINSRVEYIYNIVKASYNLIDLIEVGDYVNGEKVGYIDDCDGAMREYYYDYEDVNMDVGHWFEEIKSIVTKEQFNSVKYEV